MKSPFPSKKKGVGTKSGHITVYPPRGTVGKSGVRGWRFPFSCTVVEYAPMSLSNQYFGDEI